MTSEPELMSWHSRFVAALMVLTGAPNEPPGAFVAEWFDKNSKRVDDRLQNWVGQQPGVPWWAQAIAVIDAARIMADQPIEGSDGIDYENPTNEAGLASHLDSVREFTESQAWYAARAREHGGRFGPTERELAYVKGTGVDPLGRSDFLRSEEAENVGARIEREWGKVAQERIAQAEAERARVEAESVTLDAGRYRFLEKHWHSHMEGLPLHRWVEKTKLRWGGLSNALDHVMKAGQ